MDKHVDVLVPNSPTPLSITGSADDFGVIGAIERAQGNYEPQVMNVLSRVVQPADVCVDIGANIGILALLMARLAFDGTVYAFEPGDTSYAYLAQNVETAHAANVVAAQMGVYDITGTLELQVAQSHPGGAYISQTAAHEASSEKIHVTRLDDWAETLELTHVDVIKLDIEGAELRVIEGARRTLERFRPFLVVECNPVALERFQKAGPDDLVGVLRDIYGKVFYIDGSAVREITTNEQIERELRRLGIVDLVCGTRAEQMVEQPAKPTVADIVPRLRHVAGRALRRTRRTPPPLNYIHSPSYEARFDVNRLVSTEKATVTLPVVIKNTGEDWFSSTFPNHPVCASYRFRTASGEMYEPDGIRSFFREPLGPGATTVLPLMVAMPDQPGEYVLEFALVQEAFAWLDHLRPGLTLRLPVTVR